MRKKAVYYEDAGGRSPVEEFIEEFDVEISKLRDVFILLNSYPDHHTMEWLEKLKQMIHGRLAFIQFIYGKEHPIYKRLSEKFNRLVINEPIETSVSWRYAGYEIF